VHPRPSAVVGLKGPLALGHGCHSLLRLASATHADESSYRWGRECRW
jgi:hypothetical protein